LVSGKAYIGSFASLAQWWSNQVLPFLGIVLVGSFVKQVYNYLFVAVDKQNVLLPINLIGILVGIPLWIWMIPTYWLLGWIITQLSIELLFMFGAIRVGKRKKIQPIFSLRIWWILVSILLFMSGIGYAIMHIWTIHILRFFVIAFLLNSLVIYVSLPYIKKIARGLTVEDWITPIV
jgi:O-antigen/teichoic acid export membrane protein